MEEIQLKDICDLDNGYAFKSEDYVEKSGTLNCRMSNIRPDGTFDILYSAKYLPDEFADKYEEYILHDGDLIIAMTDMAGDPKILGVPTVVNTQGYTLLLNQRVGRLRFIKNGVNADYLKLALQCPKVRNYLKIFAGGGVQLNVSKKDILSTPVQMRNEKEQTYIADIFKSVFEIKAKREHELQLLDELIKARFVEMFGSIREERLLGEISEFVTVGIANSATHAYAESGVPMLRNQNIKENYLDDSDLIYIKPEFAAKYDSKRLKQNDIIVMRTGYPGVACLVPEKYEGCQTFTTLIVRLKPNNNPSYVCSYINSDFGKQFINSEKVGVAQQNVGAKSLAKMPIKIAPKEIQNEFATFVKQVDKSKFKEKSCYIKYKILKIRHRQIYLLRK